MTLEHDQSSVPGTTGIRRIGERWVESQTERMLAGEEKVIKIVDVKVWESIKDLPSLTGRKRRKDAKYDDEGNIYITRWDSQRTMILEDGRRTLLNPEGIEFKAFTRRKLRDDYFQNLPKKPPVVKLVENIIMGGIEVAIRQQVYILSGYKDGGSAPQIQQARNVIEKIDQLSDRVIGEKLTKESLQIFAREIFNFLEDINLTDPKNPRKIKALEKLQAMPRLDKLGRVNFSSFLLRGESARLAAIGLLLEAGFKIEKFDAILQSLVYWRETQRWALDTGGEQLDRFLGHAAFLRKNVNVGENQRKFMVNKLRTIAETTFALARTKPYLQTGLEVGVDLVGCREIRKPRIRVALGEERAEELFAQIPVKELILSGNFAEAEVRIRNDQGKIKNVLKEYASIPKKQT